jgi:hypothetical protein
MPFRILKMSALENALLVNSISNGGCAIGLSLPSVTLSISVFFEYRGREYTTVRFFRDNFQNGWIRSGDQKAQFSSVKPSSFIAAGNNIAQCSSTTPRHRVHLRKRFAFLDLTSYFLLPRPRQKSLFLACSCVMAEHSKHLF